MPNIGNLTPFTSEQDREKARENGRKGGKASGEAKRKRKAMRECFEEMLRKEYVNHNGEKVDGITLICMKQFRSAVDGDVKAFQIIRDAIGEMPAQKIEVDTIDPSVRDEMDRLMGL